MNIIDKITNKTVDKITNKTIDKITNKAVDKIITNKTIDFDKSNIEKTTEVSDKSIDIFTKKNDKSIDIFTKKNDNLQEIQDTKSTSFKLIIIIFLLFIFISSDIFTNTILSCFGKRMVRNRHPTACGVLVQGVILVLFYILFATLIKKGVI